MKANGVLYEALSLALLVICATADDSVGDDRVHFGVELPEVLGQRWRNVELGEGVAMALAGPMNIYIMMKHCPVAVKRLEEKLLEISNPMDKNYGQYLTLEEIGEMTKIPDENIRVVTDFLESNGVTEYSINPNSDIIKVSIEPSVAESMFQTKIGLFQSLEAKRQALFLYRATQSYSLPTAVSKVIDLVGDLEYFPSVRHPIVLDKKNLGQGSWENDCDGFFGCRGLVTPGVLRKAYSISESTQPNAKTTARKLGVIANSMAVAEFQGQYYDDKDLEKFSAGCHTNVTVDKIVGRDIQRGGLESMLDIEYIKALAPEVPLAFVYLEQYSLFNWAYQISLSKDPQLVHSVSYGNDEAQQISTSYMFNVNTQLIKAGSRGLSILFASGDQGVCGREGCGLLKRRYKPDFPAGSPYVTAVGGTNFLGNEIGEESAWNCGGGGFSDTFAMPDFQKKAVADYKSIAAGDLPWDSVYNHTSRGYPDVAALGGQKAPYCVVVKGTPMGIAGTSASAPVVAAIFAKLNGERLKAGKPPMGFLNPFIYQNPDVFNDVTHGKNGCSPLTKGFVATKGWDPATGMGTPNYAKMLAKAMA